MNYQNYISAGSLLACSSLLSSERLNDILSTSAFMQMSSSNKYPTLHEFKEWNDRYAQVLRYCRYVSSGRLTFEYSSTSQDRIFTPKGVIVAAMASELSPEEKDSLNFMLERFSELKGESKASKVFTQRAIESAKADVSEEKTIHRIRILAGVVDADSTLKCVIFNLATHQPIEFDFFNQNFALGDLLGHVDTEYFAARLDEDYAEEKRVAVLKTLAGRGDEETERLF
ncbi:hypothetical protein [Pseudomonas atagonensis]|uniref:hypothetical protein n=1 Tax=Pseudomonas atagonensis TaxID=2609964 RepID=UPI001409B311|nr:hypothetical protein [Pseudomonas atagonensis]